MKTPEPLYKAIASAVQAHANCVKANNSEWRDNWRDTVDTLCANFLPSGSGIDHGTKLDWDKSTGDKLVFETSYHHMSEHGFYDGWTDHTVVVKPSLQFGIDVTITGRDRNDIKDYLAELYGHAMDQQVWQVYREGEWVWMSESFDRGPEFQGGEGI